jgi:hypothetical protein
MYASVQDRQLSYSWLFRNCGRLGGLIVMISCAVLALYEATRSGAPAPEAYVQAGALAIVFAGYVIGWSKEMLGGALAVAGTVLFYVLHIVTIGSPPLPTVALFAVPGVFFMLARYLDERRSGEVGESHEH